MSRFLFVLLALAAVDSTPIPLVERKAPQSVDFTKSIAPIFAAKCAGCHTAKEPAGGFDATSYTTILRGGKQGGIIPGKGEESRIWKLATHRAKPVMPPAGEGTPLTSDEATLLKEWIDLGAKGGDPLPVAKKAVANLPAMVRSIHALLFVDSRLVAATGNRLILLDAATGRELSELKSDNGHAHAAAIESLAVTPDGKRLLSGSYGEVKIWNLEKGTEQLKVTGFADRVVALDVATNGELWASGGGMATERGEVQLHDGQGKVIRTLTGPTDTVYAVRFSPDGKKLAVGSADRVIRIYDVETGKAIVTLDGHTHHVLDVVWSADGKRLASASADSQIKIWDVEKGEKLRDLTEHRAAVSRLAVSKQGGLYSVDAEGRTIAWNFEGSVVRRYPSSKEFLTTVALDRESKTLATSSEEGTVTLFEVATGKKLTGEGKK